MEVVAELTLFPHGAREGLPAAAVDITGEGDLPSVGEIMGPLSRVARPGVSLLWLRKVPWGSYQLDRRVHEFTYGLPHMQVVATADTVAEQWSNLQNIGWVVDVTALVDAPTTAAALTSETVQRATRFMPIVQEIVATKIADANLLPGVLGALANMWSCEHGTIYVRPEQALAAKQAVAAAGVFAARVRA